MFKHLSIKTKVTGGFAIILVLLVGTVYVSYNCLSGIVDRIDKADDVNRMVKGILEVRRQEKNYIIRHEDSYVEIVNQELKDLLTQVNTTKAKFRQKVNKDQMDAVVKEVTEYTVAFQSYVNLEKQKDQVMEEMRTQARIALTQLEDVRRDQQKQFAEGIEESTGQIQTELKVFIDDKLTKAEDANRLIKWFLEIRKNEKEFIITNGAQEWKDARQKLLTEIMALAADLKSRFTQDLNIMQIDEAITALTAYDAGFQQFANLIQQQSDATDKMVIAAREAIKECETARADQKTKMQSQMFQTKNIMFVSGLVALLFGSLCAFLIIRAITTPVKVAMEVADQLAVGNVNIGIPVSSNDEMGQLLRSMQNMADSMKRTANIASSIASGDLTVEVVPLADKDLMGIALAEMVRSLQGQSELAQEIAKGNLSVEVTPRSNKDVLGNALAEMVRSLQEQISEITESTEVLASSGNEITALSAQLVAATTESSTALSQTTTTVEEVKQTSQTSNDKAKQISADFQKTAQISQAGEQATEDTIKGMNLIREQMESIAESVVQLSEQSQAVGEIISSVDDIAEQSNLLAVNAAIEAAKAGEQGKGFAVVAEEIKSLAEQSKRATAQVRSILNEIQKATSNAVMVTEQGGKVVDTGADQTVKAGEAIRRLTDSVSQSAQAATQIAASSQQQLVGMEQIAKAMENIKQASGQNLQSTKQLEMAARNLDELGKKLQELVQRYQVKRSAEKVS